MEGLISKEKVVPCQWGSEMQTFGNNLVYKIQITTAGRLRSQRERTSSNVPYKTAQN